MSEVTLDATFGGNWSAIITKLIALIKEGAISALTNESTLVALLVSAGVPITPSEEAVIALVAQTLLAIFAPAPAPKAAAPLGRVDILARAAILHRDAFGGAKDTPLLTNLRAMRTFHGVHQLIADAGSVAAVTAVTATASQDELTAAAAAVKTIAGDAATAINWGNVLKIVTEIMAAIAATKGL